MDRKKIGRYEILGELGRGAMGSVLRAHDPAMGRDVAVKCILSAALAGDQMAEFRERFFREARAAGALSHPGIVPVFDVGEDDGVPFLVMELVQGRTLDAILRHDQRYSLDRSCLIGQQIAEALGFAHRNGVIHRDIKPANILMTSPQVYDSERPRITDFGVAKLVGGEATTTGQLLGTPAFMPPEQFTGDPIDHRTDLFALGVILYRMMTGEQPFGGETLTAVSYKVVHTEPIPPSKLNPSISPQLEAVILRCLAKNPAARYQTGEELAGHLAAIRAEALQTGTLQPGTFQSGAHATGMQAVPVTDSGAGETINQVASLRPQGSVARTYAMPMQPAATVAAAVATVPPAAAASPQAAPGSPASKAPSAATLSKRTINLGIAGAVLLIAIAAAAGFLLRKSPQQAAAPPPAPVAAQPAPVAAAPAPVAAPVTQPAGQTDSKAESKTKAAKAAAHKPAPGAKAPPPAPAPVVAVATPPPAPAPAPARPAPAPAPAVPAVSFNPKTLDAATNTHLKLNFEGLSAPLTVTVQMDGKLYWSGTAGDKKGYQGLLVPPGSHQFRVVVKGQHTVKTSNTVTAEFAAKKHMTLSVKLRPESTGDSSAIDPAAQVTAALKKDLFPF